MADPTPSPPKVPDSFRKYLDDGAVLDSLTRVLVALYEQQETPADPVEFIKQFLGSPQGVNYESLQKENAALKEEVSSLEGRVQELKSQLGIPD